jgi:lysophospholipase L1-like esterase
MKPRTLVLALALAGCKVITLGDSNTCDARVCSPHTWPGRLQERLDARRAQWAVENRGMPAMTAGQFVNPDGTERTSRRTGKPAWAGWHLEQILANDLASACRWNVLGAIAPRLVIALGTNDIFGHPAWVVVDDILKLRARTLEARPCVQVYVATIPPQFAKGLAWESQRLMVNALLRDRVPADRLIEFDKGFGRGDFIPDGVHVTPGGQEKRAEAVLRVVFPGLAGDAATGG